MRIVFTNKTVMPYDDPDNDQECMLLDELIWDLKKTLDFTEALNYNRIQAIVVNRGFTVVKAWTVSDSYIMELEFESNV